MIGWTTRRFLVTRGRVINLWSRFICTFISNSPSSISLCLRRVHSHPLCPLPSSYSLSLSHSLSLSLPLSHTHTVSLSHTHTLSLTPCLPSPDFPPAGLSMNINSFLCACVCVCVCVCLCLCVCFWQFPESCDENDPENERRGEVWDTFFFFFFFLPKMLIDKKIPSKFSGMLS